MIPSLIEIEKCRRGIFLGEYEFEVIRGYEVRNIRLAFGDMTYTSSEILCRDTS